MEPSAGRPRLHFTARRGWINDPLAVTRRPDGYHVFFQHVPDSTEWAPQCRWGHAVSPDLLHWTELPVAIEPGDGDDGVWSGCIAVDDDGTATAFTTAVSLPDVDAGRIRVARPEDDGWLRWRHGDVVVRPPADPPLAFFRDPFVLRDGDGWRMLVGAALADGRGAVLGYRSPDLATWTAEGIAAAGDGDAPRAGWECPQLIRVDGTAVLVVSVLDAAGLQHVAAATGEWADGRFTPHRWSQLTHGGHYAATAFRDAAGRPCLMHWIRGVAGEGWTGALSVPHLLAVEDGRAVLRPHPVVADRLESGRASSILSHAEWAAAGAVTAGDGPLQVLADGPVVEIWGAAGAAALPRR